jgi:hypothetical protein
MHITFTAVISEITASAALHISPWGITAPTMQNMAESHVNMRRASSGERRRHSFILRYSAASMP